MVVIKLLMSHLLKLQDRIPFSFHQDKSDTPSESPQNTKNLKKKKKTQKMEKYQCGSPTCNKVYHSYTAFYNHCKKAHNGEFPGNSQINGKLFTGPSKNRGRPRITKVDVKNPDEIEAMKSQNELIEFLGTINNDRMEKTEDVIVSVQDAGEQMSKALEVVKSWGLGNEGWVERIKECNDAISLYDLPEFYDPIDYDKFSDEVDTYNFVSIIKFLERQQNRQKCKIERLDLDTVRVLTIVWLARTISTNLLSQVIYTIGQDISGNKPIKEKQFFIGKSKRFLEVVGKFFSCYYQESKSEPIEI